jgi:hypothetical protein
MSKIILTDEMKALFKGWIIENFPRNRIVPADETSEEALFYNLIHWIEGDGKRWKYLPEQIKEMDEFERL